MASMFVVYGGVSLYLGDHRVSLTEVTTIDRERNVVVNTRIDSLAWLRKQIDAVQTLIAAYASERVLIPG